MLTVKGLMLVCPGVLCVKTHVYEGCGIHDLKYVFYHDRCGPDSTEQDRVLHGHIEWFLHERLVVNFINKIACFVHEELACELHEEDCMLRSRTACL